MEAVFSRAAARGVAIEINADPHRLDLDWRLIRRARAAGVSISIGADAHNIAGLDHGTSASARAQGRIGPDDVLNARTRRVPAFASKGRG
jgi:DNA polymerase (family 10)